jgi:Golgi apparatus protein 1
MMTMLRAIALFFALLAAGSTATSLSAQSQVRDRVAAAVEAVEGSCGADITKFCGNVSRGEGRVLLCMQAHEDQLSWRCQFALYRASRKLNRALNRVERIADACWTDIEKQCKDVSIGRCLMEKSKSLSRACQTVVAGLRKTLQSVRSLKGMRAFSADGQNLGEIVEVVKGSDGKVQAIHIQVGQFLGIGDRVVTVDRSAFEELADRVNVRLTGEAVRTLPEVKKQ